MGGIDFRERVAGSFKKIKQDFELLGLRVDQDRSYIDSFEERMKSIEGSVGMLSEKVEDMLGAIDSLRESIEEKFEDLYSGTSSIGNEGVVPNGNSSTGSDPQFEQISSKNTKKKNPQVSRGTSPKRDSKRAIRIKDAIISINSPDKHLKDIYKEIVVDKELCGKTTFYRFIKELEEKGVIEIFLNGNHRKIQVKGKL